MPLEQLLEECGLISVDEAKTDPQKRDSFFRIVKDRYTYATYYKDLDLRNALFGLMECNPSIPSRLREILESNPGVSDRREDFIAKWKQDGIWVAPEKTAFRYAEFFEFCDIGESVIRPFAANNLHNAPYFYSKILEWFISYKYLQSLTEANVADLGAAYFGFGKIIEPLPNLESIHLVDIAFNQGVKPLTAKTFAVGASVAEMDPISDASMDFVTLHNAFEHFSMGADALCIKEIKRILKPGGTALISPFFFSGRYSISLNPISAFYFLEDEKLYDYVMKEHRENGAFLRFSKTMLSPYARIFDYRVFKDTFLEYQNQLIPKLHRARFDSSNLSSLPNDLFGIEFRPEYFAQKDFYFLEIANPE